MILQALKEYYDRKAADHNSNTAEEGFEKKSIPFIVVINSKGELVNIEDTREKIGKTFKAKEYILPRSEGRTGTSSYKTTFLLWDHIGFLFGHPDKTDNAIKQHQTWLNKINTFDDDLKSDEGVSAILRFYKRGEVQKLKEHTKWKDCIRIKNCNMTFRLVTDPPDLPVPCRPAVRYYVQKLIESKKASTQETGRDVKNKLGYCLVTGIFGEIAEKFGDTPINKDSKKLVSFQKKSGYDSYGKEQGYNSPILKSVEFAFVTGLNMLLHSKRQRVLISDTNVVFWSAKKSDLEQAVVFFFSEPSKDNPDNNTEEVRSLYNSIWSGAYYISDDDTRFYILGLAPNKARISVKFWHVSTVKKLGVRLQEHVKDLAIYNCAGDSALPLRRLLSSIAAQGDEAKIPPKIMGDMVKSILEGMPYPQSLFNAIILRIRAEQSRKDKKTGKHLPNVTYERAALLKACINRLERFKNSDERELAVSLDESNTNIGYQLGRLFAVLEKVQQEANPGINATIRDRFYGAASGTPVAVFANLMRLKNHHLAKMKSAGRRVQFEKLIGSIIEGVGDFPPHLSLADQGRFAIGYYHQMQDFYTKKSEKSE